MKVLRRYLLLAAALATPFSSYAQTAKPSDADRALAKARLAGAADADIQAFLANRDPRAAPYYRALFVEGERNAVLNFDRVALLELQQHHVEQAQRLFDQAANRIEAIYANDANAVKARSLWTEESVKDFKGEPYERAMTFYYRGLTWLMLNDYDNAHANFKRAEEQTLVSEAENYNNSSFAALTYLQAWASHCAGNEGNAADEFRTALSSNSALRIPAKTDNLLLVSEVGTGPTKSSKGQYHEMLQMVAGSGADATAFEVPPDPALNLMPAAPAGNFTGDVAALDPVALTPVVVNPVMASNISEQSMMRDGRPVDVILKGKAEFKNDASIAGSVGVGVGTGLMEQGMLTNNNNMAGVGAGFAIFGVIASVASAAATPAADMRYWDTLPNGLNVATARLPAGVTGVKLHNAADMYMPRSAACAVAWSFQNSVLDAPASAPNADGGRKLDSQRLQKDAVFRAALLNDFLAPPETAIAAAPAPLAAPASSLTPVSARTSVP